MPTVDVPEIRVKTAFNGEVMITYIDPRITFDQLRYEMRVICRFSQDQEFTMKWVDEEGNIVYDFIFISVILKAQICNHYKLSRFYY